MESANFIVLSGRVAKEPVEQDAEIFLMLNVYENTHIVKVPVRTFQWVFKPCHEGQSITLHGRIDSDENDLFVFAYMMEVIS